MDANYKICFEKQCPSCSGSGIGSGISCFSCGGHGKIIEHMSLDDLCDELIYKLTENMNSSKLDDFIDKLLEKIGQRINPDD